MREATWEIRQGDVREQLKLLPSDHFHCCVTSPPYWGLRSYLNDGDDDKHLELGSEKTPSDFIRNMVEVFREVKRVMRPDSTTWINMGDCYATSRNGRKAADIVDDDRTFRDKPYSTVTEGLKPKDLVGMPWRLALALQDDGWWLRSDIIWSKPNPLPSSVTDRPGCAHEYIFLLTKAERYFYDQDAVRVKTGREADPEWYEEQKKRHAGWSSIEGSGNVCRKRADGKDAGRFSHPGGRGLRTVWEIPTEPVPFAHFACFPSAIPRTAILAGTSAAGCCSECGAPWKRETEKGKYIQGHAPGKQSHLLMTTPGQPNYRGEKSAQTSVMSTGCVWERITTGWTPSCSHNAEPIPCRVLEPFAGSGTTLAVARQLKRDSMGIELNPEYNEIAERRIGNALRSGLKRQEDRSAQPSLFESEAI